MSAETLHEISGLKAGKKCEHNQGRWIVAKGKKFLAFDPPTQLQKDIYLIEIEKNQGKEAHDKAIKSLRWLCYQCGTVQKP